MGKPPILKTSNVLRSVIQQGKYSATGFFANLLTRLLVALYLLYFGFFDTDPHHDGYVLGSAAAVAEGRNVHSGAFSQYGPMTPWVAGFFLKLTAVSIFNLRVLSAIAAMTTFLLIEKVLRKLDFTQKQSQLAAISWVLMNHVTTTVFPGTFILWPSLLSTLFMLCSLNFFLLAENSNFQEIAVFCAGVFVSLAFFTRIQSILVIVILAFSYFVFLPKGREFTHFVSGFAFTTISILIFIHLTGSFAEFIYQVFVWPLSAYPKLATSNNYNIFLFIMYVTLAIAFLLYMKLLNIGSASKLNQKILLFGTLIFVISHFSGNLLSSDQNVYLRLFLGDQLNRILVWPLYFSYIVSIAHYAFLLRSKNRGQLEKLRQNVIVGSFGLSVTPQILPYPDLAHLWWISPLLIISALLFLKNSKLPLSNLRLPILTVLVGCLISSLAYTQRNWTEYNYEPLKGTYASQTKANSVNIYTPIYKYIQNEKAVFLCSDGIHAVANGKYAAWNEWFVDWGRKDKNTQLAEMTRSNLVIMCDKKESEVRRISKLTGKEIEFFDEVEGDTYRSLAVLKKRVKP